MQLESSTVVVVAAMLLCNGDVTRTNKENISLDDDASDVVDVHVNMVTNASKNWELHSVSSILDLHIILIQYRLK